MSLFPGTGRVAVSPRLLAIACYASPEEFARLELAPYPWRWRWHDRERVWIFERA